MNVIFRRTWVCEVFTSGYHNGCICTPDDPHGGWNCGYRLVGPTFQDNESIRTALATATVVVSDE